jgi:hypothetical protein
MEEKGLEDIVRGSRKIGIGKERKGYGKRRLRCEAPRVKEEGIERDDGRIEGNGNAEVIVPFEHPVIYPISNTPFDSHAISIFELAHGSNTTVTPPLRSSPQSQPSTIVSLSLDSIHSPFPWPVPRKSICSGFGCICRVVWGILAIQCSYGSGRRERLG